MMDWFSEDWIEVALAKLNIWSFKLTAMDTGSVMLVLTVALGIFSIFFAFNEMTRGNI